MSEFTKLLAAVGLITAGFFSASLFSSPDHSADSPQPPSDWSPQPLEPIGSAAPLSDSPTTWDEKVAPASHVDNVAGTPVPEIRRRQPFPGPGLGDATAPTRLSLEVPKDDEQFAALSPPPLLSPESDGRTRPSTFPKRPSDTAPSSADTRTRDWDPPSLSAETNQGGTDSFEGPSLAAPQAWSMSTAVSPRVAKPVTPPAPATWHVVSDGDSLARIAERYLGDASRSAEIFELNRDTLSNPDLLPIGVELRIPRASVDADRREVFDANGSASNQFVPQRRLVPLPELRDSVTSVPRARLQPPVAASFAGSAN